MASRGSGLVLLLAGLLAGVWGATLPTSTDLNCSFVDLSPRYVRLDATLQIREVETGQLLSDALSSALQSALGVPECALQLSEGQACALSGPSAACASPFYVCGGAVLSSDLYQLAVSGECASSASSSTSDCKLLEAQLGSSTLQGRTCTASCVLPDVNNLTALLSPAVEAPAPAGETEDENGTCASFSVQILAATEADAETLSTTLVSDKAAATVIGGVAAFATRATEFVAYPSGARVRSTRHHALGMWVEEALSQPFGPNHAFACYGRCYAHRMTGNAKRMSLPCEHGY